MKNANMLVGRSTQIAEWVRGRVAFFYVILPALVSLCQGNGGGDLPFAFATASIPSYLLLRGKWICFDFSGR